MEGIEDALDRLEERLAGLSQEASSARDGDPLKGIEARIDELARDLSAVREALAPAEEPVSRRQERLTVGRDPG